MGSSEYTTSSETQLWLAALVGCVGGVLYRDQHEGSRPDAVVMVGGAVALRVEEKYAEHQLDKAVTELTAKMPAESRALLPSGTSGFPGMAVSVSQCRLMHVEFSGGSWRSVHVRTYNLGDMDDRVSFLVAVFQIARWMVGITGPASGASAPGLPPGVRQRTRNGHWVTWCAEGLLKRFSRIVGGDQLQRIASVYSAKMDYIERGRRVNGRSVCIWTVGVPIRGMNPRASSERVMHDVHAALQELHSAGWAHCDVCVDNVFWVQSVGRFVLGDLEFVTPASESPPRVRRCPENRLGTALELDAWQLEGFSEELVSL
jgi:hypothetical protein